MQDQFLRIVIGQKGHVHARLSVVAKALELRQHSGEPQVFRTRPMQGGVARDGREIATIGLARQHAVAHAGVFKIGPQNFGLKLVAGRNAGAGINRALLRDKFRQKVRQAV